MPGALKTGLRQDDKHDQQHHADAEHELLQWLGGGII